MSSALRFFQQNWYPFARRFLVGAALGLLFLLPVSALIGATDIQTDDKPYFLIAWGGDGGIPALALVGHLPEAPREATILLPGSGSAGASLRVALQNSGINTLTALFLPTGAPFPKGANALLKGLSPRRLIVAEDSRSRTDWQSIVDAIQEQGASLEKLQPANVRIWTAPLPGQWMLTYRKLPDSEIAGTLSQEGYPVAYRFENLVTGEFLLKRKNGEQTAILATFPHYNRAGSRKVPLGD